MSIAYPLPVCVPDCAEGPCGRTVVREGSLGAFEHAFAYEDGIYVVDEENELPCGEETIKDDLRLELEVTEAERRDGNWVATAIDGSLTSRGIASPAAERLGCVDTREVDDIAGTVAA